MTKTNIYYAIEKALKADKKAFPNWPDHPARQAGKIAVEAGKLMDAYMNEKYGGIISTAAEQAAIRAAALSIRFLLERPFIKQK